MSILRKFDRFNEECIVCFENEGDEHIFMPLCGVTDCLPGYRIRRKDSPEWVFEYIVSGRGTYRCGDRVYHPGKGDLYIAAFGSDHEYASDDADPWHKIWFNVRGTLVQNLMYYYQLENVKYLSNCGLETVFREGLASMRENCDNAKETSMLVVSRLIYQIAEALHGKRKVSATALRLKQLLDEKITFGGNFAEAVCSFPYSASQLARIFKAAYGETPYAYLLARRLEVARVMLRNSAFSVKEIAARTGFSDPYYFSNLFKRKFGKAPRFFRFDACR